MCNLRLACWAVDVLNSVFSSTRLGLLSACLLFSLASGCVESEENRSRLGSLSNANLDSKVVTVVSYAMYDTLEDLVGQQVELFHPQIETGTAMDRRTLEKIQSSRLILLEGTHNAGWVDTISLPQSRVINTTFEIMDQLIMVDDLGSHTHGPGGEHSHKGIVAETWLDPIIFGKQIELALSEMVTAKLLSKIEQDEAVKKWQVTRAKLEAQMSEISSKAGVSVLTDSVGLEYLCRRLNWSLEVQPMAQAADEDVENFRLELSKWLKENPSAVVVLTADMGEGLESTVSGVTARVLKIDLIQTEMANSHFIDRFEKNLRNMKKFVDTLAH